MRGSPIYVGSSFAGGLNTRDSAFEVDITQARDLLNVVGTVSGAVRKRRGNETFASPSQTLLSLIPVDLGTSRYLIGQGGTGFYRVTTGGSVSTITGTTVPTSGARWNGVQAPAVAGQGPVYMVNGVDTPQQWTGSGNVANWAASTGAVPNGKVIAFAGNRIFVAVGDSLYWSDIGNPNAWPPENVTQFDPADGEDISGIGTIGPYVLVFKPSKTWLVYDLDTGANRALSRGVGCAAQRSIVETPGGTYFLTLDKGVYVTNGSTLEPISDIIRPTLEDIVPSLRQYAAGAFLNNHYYLACALDSGSSSNDHMLDFDTQQKSWWKHSIHAHDLAVWRPIADAELYVADSDQSRIERCFVNGQSADSSSSFEAYWTSAWLSPSYFRRRIINSPDMRKRLRQIRFDASGVLSLYIARNFVDSFSKVADYNFLGTPTTFAGAGTFGGDGVRGDPAGMHQERAKSLGVQRSFSLRWHSDTSSPWELEDYVTIMGERTD